MSKEAMKLALEALKPVSTFGRVGSRDVDTAKAQEAIKALEEALAKQQGQSNFCPQCEALARELKAAKQEQGEPVGEILLTNGDYKEVSWKNGKLPPIGAKLYTTLQPAQKPMMEEQIFGLLIRIDEHAMRLPKGLLDFARAIEAAHGIKE